MKLSALQPFFKKMINEEIDRISGGKADNLSVKDIAKKHNVPVSKIETQLKKGIKVEKEHTNSKSIAREIAKDHLAELPNYYTKLNKMEKDAEKKS